MSIAADLSTLVNDLTIIQARAAKLELENERLKAQPVNTEAIDRLLDLLEPDVVRAEAIILHEPRLIELVAVYREIRPK